MKTFLLSELFFSGLISTILVFIIFSQYYSENEPGITDAQKQKYRPFFFLCAPPALLISVHFLSFPFLSGTLSATDRLINMFFDILVQHSFYYMILLLTLPALRKHISPRICALFWLLPNYSYLLFHENAFCFKPLYIIHSSSHLIMILVNIWMAGFYLVLLWKITEHFLFRRKILKHAIPVTDPRILSLFQEEADTICFKKTACQLVTTKDVPTPLSIGLFYRSTKIILPHTDYSPYQLKMIFRHELIHISRQDSWTKFFLLFYVAMFWFNPFIWFALKKSAEDLELSCDETMLLNADQKVRSQYADLILHTAGDNRGFSTCLSSSASSLRYRLKSIMNPGIKHSGVLVIGITFFILSTTYGYVSLAYGESTAKSTIFSGKSAEEYTITRLSTSGMQDTIDTVLVNNKDFLSLTHYIADLTTQKMTGNYEYYLYDERPILFIYYDSPYGVMNTELHTDFIKVTFTDNENVSPIIYHLPEGTDWDYIDRLLLPLTEK